MQQIPTILIVQTGTTEPAVVSRFGDYDDWFRVVFEPLGSRCRTVRAFQDAELPGLAGVHGVVLTGSPLSVRDAAPWMPRLGQWAVDVSRQIPVLAVCFGHQLVGEALGGRVDQNPEGGEYGTIRVPLGPASSSDPVFGRMNSTIEVQSTHRDILIQAPTHADVVHIGSTPNTDWQMFRWGEQLHAVQFHPELAPAALRLLLQVRGIEASVRETPDGQTLLASWLDYVRSQM